MSDLRKQLAKLKEQAEGLRQQAEEERPPSGLELFERVAALGILGSEPDAEQALQEYRDVVAQHGDTPVQGEPWAVYKARQNAFMWLSEMFDRARQGKPPVTLTEYESLRAWFEGVKEQLYAINPPVHTLDVGDGQHVSLGDIADHFGNWGPRRIGTTEIVEQLRLLKARHERRTLRPTCDSHSQEQ